jgi:hypothetical protein
MDLVADFVVEAVLFVRVGADEVATGGRVRKDMSESRAIDGMGA